MRVWNPIDATCYEILEEHGADVSKVALKKNCLVSVAMDGTTWYGCMLPPPRD